MKTGQGKLLPTDLKATLDDSQSGTDCGLVALRPAHWALTLKTKKHGYICKNGEKNKEEIETNIVYFKDLTLFPLQVHQQYSTVDQRLECDTPKTGTHITIKHVDGAVGPGAAWGVEEVSAYGSGGGGIDKSGWATRASSQGKEERLFPANNDPSK